MGRGKKKQTRKGLNERTKPSSPLSNTSASTRNLSKSELGGVTKRSWPLSNASASARNLSKSELGGVSKRSWPLSNASASARNLSKSELGGVIFGCTYTTIEECLSKEIFGLPARHFSYVRNIEPGLPLFLFNYSDRKLHGVFEAESHGQMYINRHGWTKNDSETTSYPAQVRIGVRTQCQALPEKQFCSIIAANYYIERHFFFELDHSQTRALISLFGSLPVICRTNILQSESESRSHYYALQNYNPRSGVEDIGSLDSGFDFDYLEESDMACRFSDSTSNLDEEYPTFESEEDKEATGKDVDAVCPRLEELTLETDSLNSHPKEFYKDNSDLSKEAMEKDMDGVYPKLEEPPLETDNFLSQQKEFTEEVAGNFVTNDMHLVDEYSHEDLVSEQKNDHIWVHSSDLQYTVLQLMHTVKELKSLSLEQLQKTNELEKKMAESETQIQQLQEQAKLLDSRLDFYMHLYQPGDKAMKSNDKWQHDGDSIYLVGGYDGISWLSALDSYSPHQDLVKSLRPMSSVRSYASAAALNGDLYIFGGGNCHLWFDTAHRIICGPRPSLNVKKGSLAGASLHNKIYAIGGGNGIECFSDVEMFDPVLGQWIFTQSMLRKRFAPTAVELNGVIYVAGGYDGKNYLKSAERFDPREASWTRLQSMNTRRGCHSLAVLNEKLYALGGYDGTGIVPSVEAFDPRTTSWMTVDPLNQPRGYCGTAVIGDSIYIFGGLNQCQEIIDTVECYKEGHGWQVTEKRLLVKDASSLPLYCKVITMEDYCIIVQLFVVISLQ